jgi:hypothetical protein
MAGAREGPSEGVIFSFLHRLLLAENHPLPTREAHTWHVVRRPARAGFKPFPSEATLQYQYATRHPPHPGGQDLSLTGSGRSAGVPRGTPFFCSGARRAGSPLRNRPGDF